MLDRRPDLHVKVKTVDGSELGSELLSTKGATRVNASEKEEFHLEIAADVLDKAGLVLG